AEAGAGNVRFLAGDVLHADLEGPFDAAVGRLVLMHIPDPVAALARVREHLRPGGAVAFLEIAFAPWTSRPRSPTLERIHRLREGSQAHTPANLFMGLDLRGAFLRAGLPEPHLSAQTLIGGGPGWP